MTFACGAYGASGAGGACGALMQMWLVLPNYSTDSVQTCLRLRVFFRPEMGGQILASTSTNSSPDTKYWLRGPRPTEPQLQAAGCRIDAVCGCQNFWPRQCWCNICGIVVPTLTCGLRLSIATLSYKRGAQFKLGVGHRLVPGCYLRHGT